MLLVTYFTFFLPTGQLGKLIVGNLVRRWKLFFNFKVSLIFLSCGIQVEIADVDVNTACWHWSQLFFLFSSNGQCDHLVGNGWLATPREEKDGEGKKVSQTQRTNVKLQLLAIEENT